MSGSFPSRRRRGFVIAALAGLAVQAGAGLAAAQNGTITGTVTNQATGAPLAGVVVRGCTASGACTAVTTNASGFYSISRPPGPNYVLTDAAGDFVNEVYNDVACLFNCLGELANGSTVVVLSNFTSSQRDFALALGGRITGRVTDSATNAALSGVNVQALIEGRTGLEFAAGATTDGSGNFTLTRLPAGRYFLATASTTHVNEFFGGVICPAECRRLPSSIRGASIDVASGSTQSGRDLSLAVGATITGRLTDRATGLPIPNIGPVLFTRVGDQILPAGGATADQTGTYTIRGLAPGSYGAWVYGQVIGYVDETYDNLRCRGGCQPEFVMNSGHLITVGAAATRAGIDFALDRTGGMSGRITDALTAQPMSQVLVKFYRRDGPRLTYEGGQFTFPDGTYAWPVLPPGTYYVLAESDIAISETFPNVPCPRPCAGPDITLGTPIVVAADTQLTGIDLALDRGARISGTVTDASGPPTRATIRAYRQSGGTTELVHEVVTGPTFEQFGGPGTYTLGGLAPGTYYLLAAETTNGAYVDELLGGVHCSRCTGAELLAATPVTVGAGATAPGRDFTLDVGLNLSGTVRSGDGSQPIAGVTVNAYSTSPAGRLAGTTVTRSDGRFVLTGLTGGGHVVATAGPSRYLHEVFNNAPCPGGVCTAAFSVASGTVLSQPTGFSLFNINFALAARAEPPAAPTGLHAAAVGFTVNVTWQPSSEGTPTTSYLLEAGGAPGTTAVSLPVAGTSFTAPGVGPGVYFLRVRGVNAHGVGPASAEYTLVVGPGGTTPPLPPQAVDAWTIGSRLTMTWADPPSGPPPTGYRLEVGTAPGASNIAVIDRSARNFAFETVPPGVYFLRVRSRVGGVTSEPSVEVMVAVGGAPAPPTAPAELSSSVSGSTVTFTWTPPFSGTPTSYVLEAGSAPGLRNLAVFDTGSPATTLAVPGVPRGAYYVRLRGRNAQGVGLASNEHVVVVP